MNTAILNTLYLAGAFLLLFAFAELLYHRFKIKAEWTRKLVHFGTGIFTLLFPLMLDNHWLVLLLCASFAAILLVSLKWKLLPSINAIERQSHGSISYPVAVFVCYCFYEWYREQSFCRESGYLAFYIPILILAICDPLAALFGKRWPYGKYKSGKEYKSILGSSVFFLSAFLLSITLLSLTNTAGNSFFQLALAASCMALITCLAEGVSRKGLDNLLIPIAAMGTLIVVSRYLFLHAYV